ncbi:conserved repeat domain-containing protein [Amycolatopsis sacchari]|uniref:Conserved repeat domain-containing protein n=2 Tax=Amycolatopsis sacchari TaxID=115433 RepID=A0A1I3P669_9PSEU|nr:conserved repeat domain-containing protein [Amycolatopsis sacchari]
MAPKLRSRPIARVGAFGAAAAIIASAASMTLLNEAASAAPGTPGTPQAPTNLYAEDFENGVGTAPVLLTNYTGANGETYRADQPWLEACNGAVLNFNSPDSAQTGSVINNCNPSSVPQTTRDNSYSALRQLAWALGSHAKAPDPTSNHVVAAYTAADPGANRVEFETVSPVSLPSASGRYVTFSVDAAAASCTVSGPLYNFSLVQSDGTEVPVGSTIDVCKTGTTIATPAKGTLGSNNMHVGTYTSNGSVKVTGSTVGVVMRNANGSANGNDAAFDNIKILDVTPQLDKSFSPSTADIGGTSTLTFTITNTSELAAKNGWSFTDALPAGLTVAGAGSTTCPAGVVTAPSGGTTIGVTGNLNAGMASCTVSVPVTSSTAGTYTNGPDNVTPNGLNEPGTTNVTFVNPNADLGISKGGPAEVNVGELVTYTLVVTNYGPAGSTGYTVTDQIPAGLTDVTTSTPGCAVANLVLTCTGGPLAAQQSAVIVVTGKADGTVTTLYNTAKVDGNDPDPNPGNDTSTEVVTEVVPLVGFGFAAGALVLAGAGTACAAARGTRPDRTDEQGRAAHLLRAARPPPG